MADSNDSRAEKGGGKRVESPGTIGMDSDRWRRLEHVYDAALARAPSERSRFLAEACADDPLLQAEVESLLAQEPAAKDFLEVPAFEAVARTLADQHEPLPVG